jgi:hypothetical protein
VNIREKYLVARARVTSGLAAEDMLTTLATEGSNVKKAFHHTLTTSLLS